jgi:thiamine-monophosphate kinase
MLESDLLQAIFDNPPPVGGRADVVQVGPGDDLALIGVDGHDSLLVGVDQVVDGLHVDAASTSWDLIARKSVHRAVSDIAAMAGRPLACVIAVVLPRTTDARQAEQLRTAFGEAAGALDCPLVGGDIAIHVGDGPLTIAVTVLATPPQGGPVLRSGALPGDTLWVTGHLGGTLEHDGAGRHLHIEPRLEQAATLKALCGDALHAMIDISDGLGIDAARMAQASHVCLQLDATAFPCNTRADGRTVTWQQALSDGEDHELLFATAPQAPVPPSIAGVPLSRIGQVVKAVPESQPHTVDVLTPEGGHFDGTTQGWDHGTSA